MLLAVLDFACQIGVLFLEMRICFCFSESALKPWGPRSMMTAYAASAVSVAIAAIGRK